MAPTTDLTDFVLEREFIGYGYDMPDPKWPNDAKIAINFMVQYNVGSELSVDHGDEQFEDYLLELPPIAGASKKKNDITDSMYEYGTQAGVPRLLDMFKRHGIPVTWNIFTQALEKSPYWCKAILDSDAEISMGGQRWIDYMNVKPEIENEMIRESIESLQKMTGDKTLPKGWMTDRRSNATIKLYAQAMEDKGLPLVYSSDSCSDDLPYWTKSPVEGKEGGLLMVPFSYDVSDMKFNIRGSGWSTPKDYYAMLVDTFECFYEEGLAGEAKMMTIVLHPHIIGRAGRAHHLEKFIEFIKAKEGVWIAKREEIASHFASLYPYDAKKAFGQTTQVPNDQYVPK